MGGTCDAPVPRLGGVLPRLPSPLARRPPVPRAATTLVWVVAACRPAGLLSIDRRARDARARGRRAPGAAVAASQSALQPRAEASANSGCCRGGAAVHTKCAAGLVLSLFGFATRKENTQFVPYSGPGQCVLYAPFARFSRNFAFFFACSLRCARFFTPIRHRVFFLPHSLRFFCAFFLS